MPLLGAETYTVDRELFADLGLKPFAGGGREWTELGVVSEEWADVKVEVSCLPAQFWRFTIYPKIEDVQAGVLTTGSGTLSAYWPSVKLWVEGCLQYKAIG